MDRAAHRRHSKSFSEIKIGDKAQFEVEINEETHASFAKLFGDFSPIHCDDKFCSKTKFKRKIGYGFMLTGFLSRLYGEYLPGGSSICIRQDAKFIRPFFIGDKIKIVGKVVSKMKSTNLVEIAVEMHRNGKELVFKGTGIVQVLF